MPSLIIENGSGVPGANSFATLSAADAYHADRANIAWSLAAQGERESALIRAGQYLNGLAWKGRKTGRGNAMAWPRQGVVDDDGFPLDGADVPMEVIWAQCEASLRELISPGMLSPDLPRGGSVAREKVGDIEVEYESGAAPGPRVSALDRLLAGLLRAGALPLERV